MIKPSSRLCAVAFTLLALSGGPAPAGSRTPDLSRQLEQRADQFFAGSRPGGVVLVRRGDELLLRKAYGLADVENQVPMRADAVFRLASASKQFTAMAILKLVEAGKFTLDQRIGTLDRSLPAAIGKVTLRQLLTHTSGIRNISSIPESRAARRNEATAQELLAFFQNLPPDFEPGSRFSYSNSNYILLTRLIELHSGQSYAGFLDTQLFKPLGMHQTRYGSDLDLIPRRAAGYQQDAQGQLLNAEFISMSQPQGAGGLVSSVDDLARWDQALYGTSLVRPALLTEAFRKVRLKDGSTQPYGFGWVLGEVQGLPSQEHGGFINGFNSGCCRDSAGCRMRCSSC